MTNPFATRKWQNPFIKRLSELEGTIFTCPREQPEVLRPYIAQRQASLSGRIIELCSGSGAHLIELAARNTDSLCLGVELRYKRLVRTAEKAAERGVPNLNLLQVDAQVISEVIDADSCDKIYINFPDPWDGKSRWEDKYLLSKDYLGSLAKLLKSGGSFNYKTDHERRFRQVHQHLLDLSEIFRISEYSEDLHTSEYNQANILTEFERLFASKKQPVFYLKAHILR